jgi:hypothetical protein
MYAAKIKMTTNYPWPPKKAKPKLTQATGLGEPVSLLHTSVASSTKEKLKGSLCKLIKDIYARKATLCQKGHH